jgi:hypothetical protein
MSRHVVRGTAALGVSALVLVTTGPAIAATTVAQSSATALTVSVAGNAQGSGTVTATHDGDSESVTGATTPPVGVLANQGLLNVGVLAQEATAGVSNGAGRSAACAGVAGEGGSVAQIGDSSCLVPGQPIGLSIANLDLSRLVVFDEDSGLAPLNAATDPIIANAVGPLTSELSANVAENLGNGGIFGGALGAVESRCTSTVGAGAAGSTTIVDGAIRAEFGGESVDLLNFPVHPAPNTRVVTDLAEVVDLFLTALRTDLDTTLDGQAAPLAAALDPIQDEIIDAVIAEVAPQLAPLEESVLAATLNKQTRPTAGAIDVTAIDLQVLPAARQQLGASLASAGIAAVACGPNGRNITTSTTGELPAVPTMIPAGTADEDPLTGEIAGVLALLLGAGVGVVGYRRMTGKV